MSIDWNAVVSIAISVGMLFLGGWINRWFENRPKLLTYYGHVSSFKVRSPDGAAFDAYAHTVVIRNTGRRAATNVRISHDVFPPNIKVFPAVEYHVVEVPDSGPDIVFPAVVPSQQLTISYLYFPPTTFNHITTGVRSDEGMAKVVDVLPTIQYPRRLRALVGFFTFIGIVSFLYVIYVFASFILQAS